MGVNRGNGDALVAEQGFDIHPLGSGVEQVGLVSNNLIMIDKVNDRFLEKQPSIISYIHRVLGVFHLTNHRFDHFHLFWHEPMSL